MARNKSSRYDNQKPKQRRIEDVAWVYVSSSAVRAIRYLAETKQLQLWFKDNCVIELNQPPNVYHNLDRALSTGKFWRRVLYRLPYITIRSRT